MLEDCDNELRSMVYNTQLPIDIVFNVVEDYVNFADLATNQTLTSSQTIAKAYVILNKTRRFKNDITAWNHQPETDKTWEGFKTHFRRAHQDRETTDVTLEDSELQRSNANLVQQVVNGMQQAMAAETNTNANAALLLQASVANQLLNSQIQQMQQSMNLLQTQVANQGSTQPYHDNYQSQGQRSAGGYQQGHQDQGQQYGGYQQGRGYQGQGFQGSQLSRLRL
jgi:hypothetical protein